MQSARGQEGRLAPALGKEPGISHKRLRQTNSRCSAHDKFDRELPNLLATAHCPLPAPHWLQPPNPTHLAPNYRAATTLPTYARARPLAPLFLGHFCFYSSPNSLADSLLQR